MVKGLFNNRSSLDLVPFGGHFRLGVCPYVD